MTFIEKIINTLPEWRKDRIISRAAELFDEQMARKLADESITAAHSRAMHESTPDEMMKARNAR